MKIISSLFLIFTVILLSCKSAPNPLDEIKNIESITDKIQYIEKSMQGKLDNDTFDQLSFILAQAYYKLGSFDKMGKLVNGIIVRNTGDGKTLDYIARNLAEKGVQLNDAVLASETAIKWTRKPNMKLKPDDYSVIAWEQRNKWKLSSYLDTYGIVLDKLELRGRAESAFKEAFNLDDENVDALLHLAKLDITKSNFIEAFEYAVKARVLGEEEKAGEIARQSYYGWKKTDEGFSEEYDGQYELLQIAHRETMINTILNIEAPDFTLKDIMGDKVSLKDYRGKIVLVDFWATWCPPCREELPVYQELKDEYAGDDIVFLAISTDKDTSKVIPFIEKYGYNFTVLYDKGMKVEYNVAGIPTVFIIDQAGVIRYKHVGYRPDAGEIWRAQIAELKSKPVEY